MLIKPLLAAGDLRLIGSTTFDEFKQIERDRGLARRLQRVVLEEPSVDETVEILTGLRSRYEEHHRVTFTDAALRAAAKLARRHLRDSRLPDSAIDVLDEAGAGIAVVGPDATANATAAGPAVGAGGATALADTAADAGGGADGAAPDAGPDTGRGVATAEVADAATGGATPAELADTDTVEEVAAPAGAAAMAAPAEAPPAGAAAGTGGVAGTAKAVADGAGATAVRVPAPPAADGVAVAGAGGDEAAGADAPLPRVTAADIERVIARMARIPEKQATASDKERLRTLDEALRRVVFGQGRRSGGPGGDGHQARAGGPSGSPSAPPAASCSPAPPASARPSSRSSSPSTSGTSSCATT